MPLTEKGKKVEKKFEQEYGPHGKSFFYAYMALHPEKTEKFHKLK